METNDFDVDDEPIVRPMTLDETAVEDFKAGRHEHLRVLGYTVEDGVLLDNFRDRVDCQFDCDETTGTISLPVAALRVGDTVDLASCPYLKKHHTADELFAEVVTIDRETDECIAVGYDGIDTVGYNPRQMLSIKSPS